MPAGSNGVEPMSQFCPRCGAKLSLDEYGDPACFCGYRDYGEVQDFDISGGAIPHHKFVSVCLQDISCPPVRKRGIMKCTECPLPECMYGYQIGIDRWFEKHPEEV